eukprot:TRINITY_DN8324_c0_g1_i1.p2 TRINITY_DN8324_c0_g1~~TRINITY_DN8324_c0_g1_i1.p2  ORF type:complete len:290 (+),score=87.01 TRINITY_DN8324_c0_g1_i1:52-921(+)
MSLKGRVAIVVGAGQQPGETLGNGRAAAFGYAQAGASVFCVDRDEAGAAETARLVREQFSADAANHTADVSREDSCRKMVAACVQRFGRVDIMHNNVGVAAGDSDSAGITEEAYGRIMTVNAGSMVWCVKHVLPVMRQQGSGVITLISSIGGELTLPNGGGGGVAYKMSKAAMNHLTRSAAIENAKHGIRCNAIMPGLMDTPMSIERRALAMAKDKGISVAAARDAVRDARNRQVPLRIGGKPSMGTAMDVANASVFLASDHARFITGVILPVDGGATVSTGVYLDASL